LLNNFSAVWKILFYKLLVFFIAFAALAGLVLPNVVTILKGISETGLFTNAKSIFDAFLSRSDITNQIEAFKNSLELTSQSLAENAGRLMISYLYIMIIIILANLLSGMSELVTSDIINADMSSNAKYGFSSRFIINLGKNLKYQATRLVTEVPVYIIITYIIWFIFSSLFNYIAVFALFFAFIAGVVLTAMAQAFFCCWLPEITLNKTPIFDGIRIGFKKIKKVYFNLLSSFAFINIFLFFMNIMLAFFTCGAGLLISIPMSTLFVVIFRLVTYYDLSGYKYYTDSSTIISPINEK
jgi:hypothetical protein